jgi:hypothetical protein
MRKIIFGLAVVAMAAITSAFTNKTIKADSAVPIQALFFSKTGTPSDNPSDYVYDPDGDCSSEGQACSAEWEHTGSLVKGMNPNGEKVPSSDAPGAYISGM